MCLTKSLRATQRPPWFEFDGTPSIENLLIIVTRTQLPAVPVGKELVRFCLPIGDECTWKPSKPQFDRVFAKADAPKIVSESKTLGQLLAQVEEFAIMRGIKLKAQDPEPTIVQMNLSAAQDILVMKTQLIHR